MHFPLHDYTAEIIKLIYILCHRNHLDKRDTFIRKELTALPYAFGNLASNLFTVYLRDEKNLVVVKSLHSTKQYSGYCYYVKCFDVCYDISRKITTV